MNRFIAQPIRPNELQQLLGWPTLAFLLIFLGIDWLGPDLKLADRIYQWGNGAWILRDHWVTTTFIHEGGRKLTGLFLLSLIFLTAISYRHNGLKAYRSALWYLLGVAVIAALVTNSSVGTNSSGRWATRISPAPITTPCAPASMKCTRSQAP